MRLRVGCYAGKKADERPIRFQLHNPDYLVDEALDRLDGPNAAFPTFGAWRRFNR